MILLTAMPPSRNAGAVPTAPLVRLLAAELTRRGGEVRVLTPAAEAHDWPDGVMVQIGEVTDPVAFATAVSGARRVFLAGLVGESLAPLRDLTNALITAGSARVVVLGSRGSDFEDEISGETWQWSAFERSLEKRGIDWAYLRPTALMAHTLVGGYPIPGSGVVERIRTRKPVYEYLPDAPYVFIHEQDLAEIAATLLLESAHHGTIDVSGTTVSATERIEILETVLGIEAEAVELSAEQAAERRRRDGWPEDTIAVMLYALPVFANGFATRDLDQRHD